MSIVETLLRDPTRRSAIIADAAQVLQAEVDGKSGLAGLAIKGAFKLVQGVAPGIIPQTIDALLDDFVRALAPFFDRWQADGKRGPLAQAFVQNAAAAADSLLAITDGRARRSTHKTLVGAYNKLRPTAKDHVMAAMPRVGALIERHLA